ncbi:MAG: hypothetical protein JSS81_02345 [Acidobacteria bacterium]|nr:hypothetical protein [Acidobacteriota bacterium]
MKIFRLSLLLLFPCLFAAAGCFVSNRSTTTSSSDGGATPTPAAESSKEEAGAKAATPADEIRKTDFKNYTYEPSCAYDDPKKITVKKGEYTRDKGDDKMFFSVESVNYGDLTGDKIEEAVVVTVCNTGGTGNFSEGFIYTLKDGKPELLSRIEGGDRADGGIRSAKVENGLLVVDRNDPGKNGGACCPEAAIKSKYRLEGKTLKQVGGDEKRDLYPPQRVRFERGAVDATVDVKLTDEDDIKRFIVSARAGQSLSVYSSSTDVSITLVDGDADVSKDGDSLEATLRQNGDFVIQVQKISDRSISSSITFEIQ